LTDLSDDVLSARVGELLPDGVDAAKLSDWS
jgi:hypothetical protein